MKEGDNRPPPPISQELWPPFFPYKFSSPFFASPNLFQLLSTNFRIVPINTSELDFAKTISHFAFLTSCPFTRAIPLRLSTFRPWLVQLVADLDNAIAGLRRSPTVGFHRSPHAGVGRHLLSKRAPCRPQHRTLPTAICCTGPTSSASSSRLHAIAAHRQSVCLSSSALFAPRIIWPCRLQPGKF